MYNKVQTSVFWRCLVLLSDNKVFVEQAQTRGAPDFFPQEQQLMYFN